MIIISEEEKESHPLQPTTTQRQEEGVDQDHDTSSSCELIVALGEEAVTARTEESTRITMMTTATTTEETRMMDSSAEAAAVVATKSVLQSSPSPQEVKSRITSTNDNTNNNKALAIEGWHHHNSNNNSNSSVHFHEQQQQQPRNHNDKNNMNDESVQLDEDVLLFFTAPAKPDDMAQIPMVVENMSKVMKQFDQILSSSTISTTTTTNGFIQNNNKKKKNNNNNNTNSSTNSASPNDRDSNDKTNDNNKDSNEKDNNSNHQMNDTTTMTATDDIMNNTTASSSSVVVDHDPEIEQLKYWLEHDYQEGGRRRKKTKQQPSPTAQQQDKQQGSDPGSSNENNNTNSNNKRTRTQPEAIHNKKTNNENKDETMDNDDMDDDDQDENNANITLFTTESTTVPRSYQTALVEVAKRQNIIVHLGTGTGKTLIALLLIKHYVALIDAEEEELKLQQQKQQGVTFDLDSPSGRTRYKSKKYWKKNKSNSTEQDHQQQEQQKKSAQIVFLVPSVALAIQQTKVFRANLPYCIRRATNQTIKTNRARLDLSEARILVATHGAYLELLRHFHNLFALERVRLLILDECHNCTGKSAYAVIMEQYYHPYILSLSLSHLTTAASPTSSSSFVEGQHQPKEEEHQQQHQQQTKDCPIRVLGLTASPLINVKSNHTDQQLTNQLVALETIMDAQIVSVDDLDLPDSDPDMVDYLDDESGARERTMYYVMDPPIRMENNSCNHTNNNSFHTHPNQDQPFPQPKQGDIHQTRQRDLNQLVVLYEELGPLVLGLYCDVILKKLVTRNLYENETETQFHATKNHIRRIRHYCMRQCYYHPNQGRSAKLIALEQLLDREMVQKDDTTTITETNERNEQRGINGTGAVGLVFVQRRLTALALNHYFLRARASCVRNSTNGNGRQQQGCPWPTMWLSQYVSRMQDHPGIDGDELGAIMDQSSPSHSIDNNNNNNSLSKSCLHNDMTETDFGANPTNGIPMDQKGWGQFDDAETSDDDTPMDLVASRKDIVEHSYHYESSIFSSNDQFDDADPDDDPTYVLASATRMAQQRSMVGKQNNRDDMMYGLGTSDKSDAPYSAVLPLVQVSPWLYDTIRCGCMVRDASKLFKSAKQQWSRQQALMSANEAEQEEELDQNEPKMRLVLNRLKEGEINLLIATSVVEEGVDVQACSFVVAFDGLTTIKGYIQMKGRARQKNAKFYVLSGNSKSSAKSLSLDDAKSIVARVRPFISTLVRSRASVLDPEPVIDSLYASWNSVPSDELVAVASGSFRATHGRVDLQSAKSLLYRYALTQPLDNATRNSKESLCAHLPAYDESCTRLILPAYLGPSMCVRVITLPDQYRDRPKRDRQSILALMACVRLYRNRLLTEHLLPLTKKDIRERLVDLLHTTGAVPPSYLPPAVDLLAEPYGEGRYCLYVLRHHSATFNKMQTELKSDGHQLAIISRQPLDHMTALELPHVEFGLVTLTLQEINRDIILSRKQADCLAEFFALIINARWRHRTKNAYYRPRKKMKVEHNHKYVVGLTSYDGILAWDLMELLLADAKKSKEERIAAATKAFCELRTPRLWCPLYDPLSVYVCYGPSGLQCDADFPNPQDSLIRTFQDFFRVRKKTEVPLKSELIQARPLWKLPRGSKKAKNGEDIDDDPEPWEEVSIPQDRCKSILLSQDACMEVEFANAAIFLESLFLPQLLYQLERNLMAKAFIDYCAQNLPVLGAALFKIPLVQVVEVLSAASCEQQTYDRLEWLGDGVLKLALTDVVLRSMQLQAWVSCLHEGELDSIRSILTCNDTLAKACVKLGLDRFIMVDKLSRGQWTPNSLELFDINQKSHQLNTAQSGGKVQADVIEAIVGLVYLYESYDVVLKVVGELHLTVPWSANHLMWNNMKSQSQLCPNRRLEQVALNFTGYAPFNSPSLLEEAFSHVTTSRLESSSYERLEWVGDAVICLAAREWIFKECPRTEVGIMVDLEQQLVGNHTLAFLSQKFGLHTHIHHCDPTLPGRIDSYVETLRERRRGMWGTDPPKIVADIAESLLGAVHVDGGFYQGQKAALHVLAPAIDTIKVLMRQGNVPSHPRRKLLEMAGDIVSLNEERESKNDSSCVAPNYIATVTCLGRAIVSTLDKSPLSAINRACAIVLHALERYPGLEKQFTTARRVLQQQIQKRKNIRYSDDVEELESGKA